MKIVILGNGLLGKEIHSQTGWDIISREYDGFDITRPDLYNKHLIEYYEGICAVSKYDVIINCIADTDTYNSNKQNH